MFTTLTIVGSFTAFAIVLQYALNQIICDDLDLIQKSETNSINEVSQN